MRAFREGSLRAFAPLLVAASVAAVSCGSSDATAPADQPDASDPGNDGGPSTCGDGEAPCNGACAPVTTDDAHCGAGTCASACTGGAHCVSGACKASKIEHVVLIVQENHTFETYFGRYCQADAGSSPTCTAGRTCCEGAPKIDGVYKDPTGATALTLDDDPGNAASNFKTDRDHDQVCELQQLDNGAMDKFVTGATGASTCLGLGPSCSATANWVLANGEASSDTVSYYWSLADKSALADRYFQPIAGGTASNDIYLAGAHFRFVDNANIPDVAVGNSFAHPGRLCTDDTIGCFATQRVTYAMKNIAGLLLDQGKSFFVYADGYAEAASAAAARSCADPFNSFGCPYSDCLSHPIACNGCLYDPSDVPYLYYDRFSDAANGGNPTPYVKDYDAFAQDVANRALPSFAYVKARYFRNEHPNWSTIADGVTFVSSTIQLVVDSPAYKDNTLVLLTWDEGGGFYDHVAPPPSPPLDVDSDESGQPVPYGTRVPMLAVGAFARKGAISHVPMEHSSIVKFLEYNFLTQVGQLDARDKWVNNIGSVLDPTATGLPIPEGK